MRYPLIQIGRIAKFINGAPFKPEDWSVDGTKIIRIQNLTDSNKAYNKTSKKVDEKYIVKKGDVLVSWSGTINVFIWDGEDAFLNQHIFKVVFDQSKVDKLYFNYALKMTILELSKFAHGAVMKHLVKKDFESHKIPLPTIEEQYKIAFLLRKAEMLIEQRKESLSQLNEFSKSTFLETFGDPVKNDKGWDMVSLLKLGSLERGVSKSRPRNAPELLGGAYPLIQTGEVSNAGLYLTNYSKTYSEIGLKQSKLWPKGTLLITIAANIAKTTILTFDACFPDSIVGFIANKKESESIYVHYLFGFIQQILEKNAPQAAQKNISLELLRNLMVPKPPISIQSRFTQIVEKIEAVRENYEKSLIELEQLFNSLCSLAFKGNLILNQIAIPAPHTIEGDNEVKGSFSTPPDEINIPKNDHPSYYGSEEISAPVIDFKKFISLPKDPKTLNKENLYIHTLQNIKEPYFSFEDVSKLANEKLYSHSFEQLKETVFELLRNNRFKQVFLDASFKSDFEEKNPDSKLLNELEEKMYLTRVID